MLGFSLGGAWMGHIFWPLNWLLIELPCLITLLARRRYRLLAIGLLCGPYLLMIVWSFISTVIQYESGSLRTPFRAPADYPCSGTDSLDPRYRTRSYMQMEALPFMLWAWLGQEAGLELELALRGPMPGTYHGPYPTRAQCRQVLKDSGEDISLTELWGEHPVVNGRRVKVRGASLLPLSKVDDPERLIYRAAIFEDKCLVLQDPSGDDRDKPSVQLIDLSTGERFADGIL